MSVSRTVIQAWHGAFYRASLRPLYDFDTWSHHTEAAFFEEPSAPRRKDRTLAGFPPAEGGGSGTEHGTSDEKA